MIFHCFGINSHCHGMSCNRRRKAMIGCMMGPMLQQFGLFCDVLRSLDQFPLVHFMSYYCQSNQGRQSWGLGGRDTSDFGLGVVEGRWGSYEGRGRWTGFGKQYSVFCTESTLENVFFCKKREHIW